jgi:formiminoglutamase
MFRYSVIGAPDDRGVANSHGRRGASRGPASFLSAFLGLPNNKSLRAALSEQLYIEAAGVGIPRRHQKLASAVRDSCMRNLFPVVVGGGHDYAFPQLVGMQAILGRGARLGCINIDAHLDVRKPDPAITSGSAFYLALESRTILPQDFVEFSVQKESNSPEAWEYVTRKKIKLVTMADLRHGSASRTFTITLVGLVAQCEAIVLSLDLDAIASAFAPGVSAPASEGLSITDIVEIMEIAGREPRIVSLGIYELNPLLDVDNRTARLAATAAYHFLSAAHQTRSITKPGA